MGLLSSNFDLAEPNNLTQNTGRKIVFPMVRNAKGISSLEWLAFGLRCTSSILMYFIF